MSGKESWELCLRCVLCSDLVCVMNTAISLLDLVPTLTDAELSSALLKLEASEMCLFAAELDEYNDGRKCWESAMVHALCAIELNVGSEVFADFCNEIGRTEDAKALGLL